MKVKEINLLAGLLIAVAACVPAYSIGPVNTEAITIVTYYPAPFGSYKKLKAEELQFVPRSEVPRDPVEGLVFFSDGTAKDESGKVLIKGIWIFFKQGWLPLIIPFDEEIVQDLKFDPEQLREGVEALFMDFDSQTKK